MHGDSGWLGRTLAGIVAVGVLATARPDPPWAWAVLGTGLLSFLLGTFQMKRRQPVALALLAYAAVSAALIAGLPGSNSLVLVLLAVADIAVMVFPQGYRPVIAVGIGCAVAFGISAWWWDESDSWYLSQVVWTCVLIAFGLNRRQAEVQARQTEQLLEQTRLAQREHARAAALDERGRIARELHDVLAHSLGALSVQLELAEALLDEGNDVPAALDRVKRSRRLAVQGLVEARNAVAALRADEIPALPEALAALVEQHRKDHRTEVGLTVEAPPSPTPDVVVALLGAAREALTNAAKHAPGRPVDVRLDGRRGARLTVRNAGATVGENGFGLAGMRERLALVNGKLEAGPDGDDWLVVAEVPDE
ncbi:signal transduction histidine kinase [Kribbella voronezhensis]|uniref:histidine kinase n=2 Tax=Kribbella voronezhensis TaxID=2512212 RepID=A0A4R7T6R9_9ACTN|nr:signal transduction histidine kinase [Kribbella voronezhensis]